MKDSISIDLSSINSSAYDLEESKKSHQSQSSGSIIIDIDTKDNIRSRLTNTKTEKKKFTNSLYLYKKIYDISQIPQRYCHTKYLYTYKDGKKYYNHGPNKGQEVPNSGLF